MLREVQWGMSICGAPARVMYACSDKDHRDRLFGPFGFRFMVMVRVRRCFFCVLPPFAYVCLLARRGVISLVALLLSKRRRPTTKHTKKPKK